MLGLLDDLLIVPAGIWLVLRMIPPPLLEEFRESASVMAERPASRIGVAIVVTAWLAGLVALALFFL